MLALLGLLGIAFAGGAMVALPMSDLDEDDADGAVYDQADEPTDAATPNLLDLAQADLVTELATADPLIQAVVADGSEADDGRGRR